MAVLVNGIDIQQRFAGVDQLLNTQTSVMKSMMRQLDATMVAVIAVCESDPKLASHGDAVKKLRGAGVPPA